MVDDGWTAVIHYTGRIAEGDDAGEVFDTTDVDIALEENIYQQARDYTPLTYTVGEETVIDESTMPSGRWLSARHGRFA